MSDRSTPISLPAWIIIIFSTFINSQLIYPFGRLDNKGIDLIGAHTVDSTWHLALINSLNKSVPPENPLFSGTVLSNYHYLVDLQISLLHQLTGIAVPDLFFRFVGPFYLLALSVLTYQFVYRFSGKIIGGISAVVFITVASNLYYLVPYFFPAAFTTPSVMWVDFFSTKVVNYPLLVSLCLFFVFLELVTQGKKLSMAQYLTLGFLSGMLFAVKSHTAIVWIAALLFVSPLSLITALITMFVMTRLIISSPATALQLNPFWFIKVMYESSDHLNHPDWELRRQTLLSMHAYAGIAKLYLQGVAWFVFINFGPLLLGVAAFLNKKISLQIRLVLFTMLFVSFVLTMTFIYTSTAIVTIQFIYPVIIILALVTAFWLAQLPKFQAIILTVIIWFILSPGASYILADYHNIPAKSQASSDLVSVIRYLSKLPAGTIMTDDSFWNGSIIPAFTEKPVYLGSRQIIESLGIDSHDRQLQTHSSFSCQSFPKGVRYYLSSGQAQISTCLPEIFASGNYHVYEFDKIQ